VTARANSAPIARAIWRGLGTVALDLSEVVYVLVDHEEHRVGFGT
jgi:hypothetical protein